MNSWEFTPFAIIYFISAGVCFHTVHMASRMKSFKGSRDFKTSMFLFGFYVLSFILGFLTEDPDWKLLMLYIEHAGLTFGVYFWFIFTLKYTQYDAWLSKYFVIFLGLLPLYCYLQIVFFPDDFYHRSYRIDDHQAQIQFWSDKGSSLYLWVYVICFFTLVSSILLYVHALSRPKAVRLQVFLMASVLPLGIITSALTFRGHNPIDPLNLTPLVASINGVVVLILHVRFRFFDITPVAHHLLFKGIRNPVIVVDEGDLVVELNEKAKVVLGINREEVLGEKVEHYLPGYDQLNADHDDMETKLGEALYEFHISPILDKKQEKTGQIIILTDVTKLVEQREEIARKAKELDQKNMHLQELSNYKQGLTNMIAHDLKNPLNAILSLSNKGSIDTESLKEVHENGQIMLQMVSNMLDVQKYEDASLQLKPATHNLAMLIAQAKSQVDSLLNDRSIQFESKVDAWLNVEVDKELMVRVFVNLFSNALKFNKVGGKLWVKAFSKDEKIHIEVSDSGRGISSDQLPFIFDKFWHANERNAGLTASTGLGLTFCKIALEAHGEAIQATSELGVGTTISFTLPEAKEANFKEQETQTTSEPSLEQVLGVYRFSSGDIVQLEPVVHTLQSISIFKYGQIEKELSKITNPSTELERWMNNIREASLEWSQEEYEQLCNVSNKPHYHENISR